MRPLAGTLEDAAGVLELPPHQQDPFDRLLVVRARAESCELVTRHLLVRSYDVTTRWD